MVSNCFSFVIICLYWVLVLSPLFFLLFHYIIIIVVMIITVISIIKLLLPKPIFFLTFTLPFLEGVSKQ